MTIRELLDYLDGRGLVVTDEEEIAAALLEIDVMPDDYVTSEPPENHWSRGHDPS